MPYLHKLAEYTEDQRFQKIRGDMMWRSVIQCIGDGEFKIHDRVRPVGSQNEAVFHCLWACEGEYGGERGMLNNWLVAWPCAFRLSALAEFQFTK